MISGSGDEMVGVAKPAHQSALAGAEPRAEVMRLLMRVTAKSRPSLWDKDLKAFTSHTHKYASTYTTLNMVNLRCADLTVAPSLATETSLMTGVFFLV